MKQYNCYAYCGRGGIKLEREDAIPKNLYPKDLKKDSRIQRVKVPACAECNRGFSDDESFFRSVLLLAGEPNDAVIANWPVAVRGFEKRDGYRRLQEVVNIMKPVMVEGIERHKIYPGEDDRILRIVRKVIRGLSHFHNLETAIDEDRVTADVLKTTIPPELMNGVELLHCEEDIIQYFFVSFAGTEFANEYSSFWYLKFYQRTEFYAMVRSATKVNDLSQPCAKPNAPV